MHLSLTSRYLLCVSGLSVFGLAQEPVAPSYLPEPEAVELERFEVTGRKVAQAYSVERTFTATRTDTALVNVPQSLSVITRELINDQAMSGMADLSRYVPGMGIAQGEGNRDTPVMRGNSTTADFFIDGIRDDVQYMRDLYNVDRVEVMKGPNAMIFGRGGSGGIVNRVTKQAHGVDLQEVTLQIGSWEQYRATFDVGNKLSDTVSYRVTGLYEDAQGYRDGFELQRYGVNPTLAFKLAPRTTLRVGYEHFSDERVADRGVPSFLGRPLKVDLSTFFGDPARSPVTARVNLGFALLEHRFTNGVTLRNHTRFAAYRKFYQNVFPGAVNATATTVSVSAYSQATDRDNLFNQTDVILPFATGPVKHQVLAGLELGRQVTDNFRRTGYFTSVSPTTTSVNVPVSNPRTDLPITFRQSATDADNHGVAETTAVYVQDQIELTPQLLAILGARLEHFEVDFRNNRTAATVTSRDDLFSPRAGLIYKPAAPVSLYTSYSMTSIPRAGEQLASLTLSNASLKPEKFENIEIGAKWDLRPDFAVTAALYQLDRKNVAITDPTDSTRTILVDGQRAKGIELAATGRISKQWSIMAGYAYQTGEITQTQSATVRAGARLAQLPRHTVSLWNRYDLTRQFGVGLGAIYREKLFASTDNTVHLPGFVRYDLALFYRINDRIRAQLNVENLLDRDYYSTAHSNNNITPGSPRAFKFSVTTRF